MGGSLRLGWVHHLDAFRDSSSSEPGGGPNRLNGPVGPCYFFGGAGAATRDVVKEVLEGMDGAPVAVVGHSLGPFQRMFNRLA
jgi:hypothetical protein